MVMADYALQEIQEHIAKLREGERVTFCSSIIDEVKENWFMGESKIDRIRAGLVGSSYNLRHWINPENQTVTFEKVKDDGRKWWEYPDRRHLLDTQPDGSLRRKDPPK